MTGFEMVFALFGLLLGLAFAAVLEAGGFRIKEAERPGPIAEGAVLLAVPALIALFFVKSKRANLALLALLNGLVLVGAVAGAMGR